MKSLPAVTGIMILALTAGGVLAQDQGTNSQYISIPREQYQKLLEEHQLLLEQMKEMKAFKAKMEESVKQPTPQQVETDQALADLEKQVKDVKQIAKDSYPGSTKFMLTGYGAAGFVDQNNGGSRGFTATFNPIFLWKMSDRLLFEGELEAELEGHDTSLALEIAQISYLLNDYTTIGAGKFLTPMNWFVEYQHQAWINKLPDKPLAVYDGLLPEANLGFQVHGAVPVGSMKFTYAAYAGNAPELRIDAASVDPIDLGTLDFNNFDNVGNHVAAGGRIGFFPIPQLEVGYGLQYANVAPSGYGQTVNSWLQSPYLSYVRESTALKGIVNVKAQWVWSNVGSYAYVGEPAFSNNRNGGYAQIAYRPTRIENAVIRNLEAVFRYDKLNQVNTPAGVDETRYTVGLDYWIGPSTVVKAAYQFDRQSGPNAEPHDTLLLQMATGF